MGDQDYFHVDLNMTILVHSLVVSVFIGLQHHGLDA